MQTATEGSTARLAQSVERKALNLVVVGSSPTVGVLPWLHGRPQHKGTDANSNKWTHWDLNPGPSACEADVIPLHHVPHMDGRATHTPQTGAHFVLPFGACVKLGFLSEPASRKGAPTLQLEPR